MRAAARSALLVVCLLAGCTLPAVPSPTDERVGLDQRTVGPDNLWGERTLTVAVENRVNRSRDFVPLVREGLEFWSANADRYAGYPLSFDLRPNASDPDLVVTFVDQVGTCGDRREVAGCAPHITAPGQVRRPETVTVLGGFSDASTVHVVKHELGHALGLDHDDAPQSVMAASAQLAALPQPNATERALPWLDPTLSVYVGDVPEGVDRATVDEQVGHALDYFDRGADGTVPANVSFRRTDDRAAADVVVRFADSARCTGGPGSCGSLAGRDPDDDGAVETYTRLTVTLADVPTEAVGWHVGYWLARGFGLEADERPPPFVDASPRERQSEWWT